MRHIAALLTLGWLLVTSGCVPSLHPLYSEKDVVFEPALLGEWVESKPDSKSTLTFTKSGDSEYKLISVDGNERSSFDAHLVKLGDKLFLDVASDSSVNCPTLCMPVHMFWLVSQTQPTLRLRDFNEKWLEEYVKNNPTVIKHEIVDKDVVLTASTKQLQSFIRRHVTTKEAFAEAVDYVRKE